jgi:hypothetical protein
MAAAARGLGNGGAKDAGLGRKGSAAAALVGKNRRPEQRGCGGVRPSRMGAAPGGMAGFGLGFGGCCLKCELRLWISPVTMRFVCVWT